MVKVKLSLCLTKYHTLKTCCIVEVQLHAFLLFILSTYICLVSITRYFGTFGLNWLSVGFTSTILW